MSEPAAPLITFIPWSQNGEGLNGELTEAYITSFTMGQVIPKAYQPVEIRVGEDGRFAVLGAGGIVIDVIGGIGESSKTPVEKGGRILDFITLQDSYIILRNNKEIILEKVEMDGAVQWTRTITNEDLKDADQLLWNGKQLFLTSGRSKADLLEINTGNGKTIRKIERDAGGKPSVLLSGDRVLTVAYFPEERKRGISVYDLNAGTEKARPFDDQWYGSLATAIGVDDQERVTMFTIPAFGAETGLLRLDNEGEVNARLRTIGFAPGPENKAIFYGGFNDGKLTVQRYNSRSMQRSWDIPESLLKEEPKGRFEYGGLDEAQKHQFYFRDGMGYYHTVLSCGLDGKVELRKFEADEVITRMQPASTWLVQGDGSVLIPVTTVDGLSILKVEF